MRVACLFPASLPDRWITDMATTGTIKASVWEDGGATCMARVAGADGANITQASLSTITVTIFNRRTKAEIVSVASLTVANVVFDTLQTDARWSLDSSGYNFRHTVAASSLATPGIVHAVEYKFTPATGQVFWVVFDLTTREIITS